MALTEAYARAHLEARNVLDRSGMSPEQIVSAHDEQVERLKACEHIADGDEGWETLENLCPSTAAVARLRRELIRMKEIANTLASDGGRPG